MDTAAWGAELATALAGTEDPRAHLRGGAARPVRGRPQRDQQEVPRQHHQSYRTRHPLRVVGEVDDWEGHDPETLKSMLDNLALLREQGLDVIED